MPKQHTMSLDVVFPNTGGPVRDMLGAMAAYLAEDAERYMKTNKVPPTDPAVQDKLDMSNSLSTLVGELYARSKARWAEAKGRAT